MRTKEIDVWVHQRILMNKDMYVEVRFKESDSANHIKAKLIIEIPEQKIEITESEFNKAIELSKINTINDGRVSVSKLKKELGFTND